MKQRRTRRRRGAFDGGVTTFDVSMRRPFTYLAAVSSRVRGDEMMAKLR